MKIFVNYLYNASYRVLSLLIPLITTPYISRVLGVENIGVVNYTSSIVSYYVLFGVLGLDMYGQREIAYVSKEKAERSKVFWNLVCIRFITCGTALIIYIFALIWMQYKLYLLIWGLQIIANMIDVSWYYYGREMFRTTILRNLVVRLSGVVAVFAFVRTRNDIFAYILIQVIFLLLGNLVLWFPLRAEIDRFQGFEIEIRKSILPVIIMFLPQAIDSVYMVMDKIMLGKLANMTELGLYSQADKILKMIVAVITSMGHVLSPVLAQAFANHNWDEIQSVLKKGVSFIFLLAFPMSFGISGIADGFVVWFFGYEYEAVSVLLVLLSPIVVLMGLNSIMGWLYLMSVKREKDFMKSICIGALINLLLNSILIPVLQAKGAVIASVVAMAVMSGINYYLIKNVIALRTVFTHFIKPFVSSIIMYVFILILKRFLTVSILSTCIEVLFGTTIYIGFIFLLYGKNAVFKILRMNEIS